LARQRRRRIRYALLGCGLVAVVSAPAATWWLVGDLSAEGFTDDELDYMFRAPGWAERLAAPMGAAALFALLCAGAVLARVAATKRLQRDWLVVVSLLVLAGVIAAGIARLATAGVIGANIGGSLSIMFGAPAVAGILIWSGVMSFAILADNRKANRPSEQ
jgi:hypothetical protein